MGDMADLYNELAEEVVDEELPGALCRRCGKWFAWCQIDGKWQLVTDTGRIHKHTTTAKLSEFPLVD